MSESDPVAASETPQGLERISLEMALRDEGLALADVASWQRWALKTMREQADDIDRLTQAGRAEQPAGARLRCHRCGNDQTIAFQYAAPAAPAVAPDSGGEREDRPLNIAEQSGVLRYAEEHAAHPDVPPLLMRMLCRDYLWLTRVLRAAGKDAKP